MIRNVSVKPSEHFRPGLVTCSEVSMVIYQSFHSWYVFNKYPSLRVVPGIVSSATVTSLADVDVLEGAKLPVQVEVLHTKKTNLESSKIYAYYYHEHLSVCAGKTVLIDQHGIWILKSIAPDLVAGLFRTRGARTRPEVLPWML